MVHELHDFHTSIKLVAKLVGANFNSTADQLLVVKPQANIFRISSIKVVNPSVSLTTAAGGIYTAASKGGSAIVAAGQVYSALTAANKFLSLTLAGTSLTDVYNATTQTNFYLSLTTAQGVAATADVYIFGELFE